MATRKSTARVRGSFEAGRLGSTTRSGSPAFHRKRSTLSARDSMKDINTRYSELVKGLRDVTPGILEEVLPPVLMQALVYCPVRMGDLRRSGKITSGSDSKYKASAAITFGSPSVKYAALVHERTGTFHQPPTRAKFLQSAMEEGLSGFIAHLAVIYAAGLKS